MSWYFTVTSSPTLTNSVITVGFLSAFSSAILWLPPLATTVVALSTVNVQSAALPLTASESAVTAVPLPGTRPGLRGLAGLAFRFFPFQFLHLGKPRGRAQRNPPQHWHDTPRT